MTPEAGVCDQAEAAAKDADKAVEGAEKSAADVKAEVVDQVVAGEAKDTQGKDLSQAVLDANAKVEDKTVEGGSSLKDAESAVENADTALGVAEAKDKLSMQNWIRQPRKQTKQVRLPKKQKMPCRLPRIR